MKRLVIAIALLGACGEEETAEVTSTATTSGGGAAGGGGAAAGGGGASAGGAGGTEAHHVDVLYVANQNGDSISWYTIDDDGALTAGDSVTVTHPGPLALHPSQTHLYAGLIGPNEVTTLAIDPSDGSLTTVDSVTVGISPVYLATDHAGGHLMVASYGDDTVQVHDLADGSVVAGAISSDSPGTNPHSVIVHPSDDWVFVPVTNGDDHVAQYAYDAVTGTITPNGEVDIADGLGPRHAVFHPTLDRLYVVNEHDDSVSTYVVDTVGGTLSPLAPVATITTLPSSFDGSMNTCADIHVTPDGAFVYASNRGHDSIAMFSVDAATGALSAIGHAPTEPRPREFEITPDGRFLYAAGQDSSMLAAYRIEADGDLTPLATYPTGDTPMWVLAVRFTR